MDFESGKIIPVDIGREMKKSYIDYAMSVIVGRALPDVRDGLKPVHRRILYTMYEDNFTSDKPHRKCATTVGDVLGRYHPHGDASVYDALVRLAQSFSLRYPLVDGHGNFGSVDGDPPAAYRYTEARMSKISMEMLTDIEKDTVPFVPNYDESTKEPEVLPSKFPNLLLNGSAGIAVGMATNIPPHNLTELINACVAMIENEEISIEELMAYVTGPDFPTGGQILGTRGIRSAYETGRGRVVMRACAEITERGNKQIIRVTEIPYQVNKTRLIENIADLVKNKVIEGISDLNDESDREGMNIVIEIKRDANANVVLNQLYKYTQLQDSFSVNMLALVHGQPKVLNLKEVLYHYLQHQQETIVRRTKFDLDKAEARAHIVRGLKIAIDNIDRVIEIIRGSKTVGEAKTALSDEFALSDIQSQAIVDMRLARLTGLERDRLENELNELKAKIDYYNSVLNDPELVKGIVRDELLEIKAKYGDERRTSIEFDETEFDMEDLIERGQCVITFTNFGYIKRMPVDTYRSQRRGGRGITGLSTREEDFAVDIFTACTHDHILFFTSKARMHKIKAYRIPETGRQAKGTAIVNLLPLDQDEKVTAIIPISEFEEEKYLIMLTKFGVIKRSPLTRYNSNRKGGLIALTLDEGDELIEVKLTDGSCELIIGTHDGMAIRFDENDVRVVGRSARGVRAINLREGDYIVGMARTAEREFILTITEKGMGKKTLIENYRLQSRGGFGTKNYAIDDRTGKIVGIKAVNTEEDIILISSDGTIIRIGAEEIRTVGRVSKGVILMRTDDERFVASFTTTEKEEESDDELIDEEGENTEETTIASEETTTEPTTEG